VGHGGWFAERWYGSARCCRSGCRGWWWRHRARLQRARLAPVMRGSEQGMETNDQQQELLGALEALGGSAGNGKLRELLGWDEPTYDAVKAPLLSAGLLLAGRLGEPAGQCPPAGSTHQHQH
jgi:hypothetical protein